MKLKNTFKLIGLILFAVALIIFMLANNEKIRFERIMFPFAFGTILAFSGACLISGEIIDKCEKLENKVKILEEELLKLKNPQNKE